MIAPLDFIPVAEETGLIVPIGEWVFASGLRRGGALAGRCDRLGERVAGAIQEPRAGADRGQRAGGSGIAPDRLELEITELVLLQESEGAFAMLRQLHDLGIKIAMDDFGTGYSSLGYLRSFPFDKIKIDQSFIRDLPVKGDSLAIIRAVVGLSSSLGITTTAEGVETEAQLDSLKSEGCSEVQGFLLAEPQPAADVRKLLMGTGKVSAVA